MIGLLVALHAALTLSGDVSSDPQIRAMFREMLIESQYGFSRREEAVFIVRMPSGHFAFVRWPRATTHDEQRWRGPIPPGTIAIAHTHPNRVPDPSRIDKIAARDHNMPVYVITRWKIALTDGARNVTITKGDWSMVEVAMR